MKMKRLALAALLPLLALAPAPAAEGIRLERLLPEKCPCVLLVEDAPALLANWEKTSLAKAWSDPAIMKFLAPLREKMGIDTWDEKSQKETGFTVKEILGLLRGQVAIACTDMSALPGIQGAPDIVEFVPDGEDVPAEPEEDDFHAKEDDDIQSGMLILARIGENREALETLMAKDLEHSQKEAKPGVEYREITEEFQGETLHIEQKTRGMETLDVHDCWAIVQDLFMTAPSKEDLQKAISNLKQGGAVSSLTSSVHFQKVRARAPLSDLLVYMDLEAVLPFALEQVDDIPENEMGITKEGIFKALGADVLQAAYLSARLGDDATEVQVGILYREVKGLVKLLAAPMAGTPARAGFIPSDATQFGAWTFDLKTLYETLEEILGDLSPQFLVMVQMTLQQMTAQTGVDIKKDLLDNLGGEIAIAKVPRPSEPGKAPTLEDQDSLVVLSVANRQALETALETLKTSLAPGGEMFEKRDYLGTTLHSFKIPLPGPEGQGEKQLTYSLTDRHLIVCVGSSGPLEGVLAALAKPGASVWERDEVRKALETLRPKESFLSYTDFRVGMGQIIETFAKIQEQSGLDEPFDLDAKPDPGMLAKYFGTNVDAIHVEPDGLTYLVKLFHPKPEAP
jgi:hypothetical protein